VKKNRTFAVIQARLGSTRFPSKMLATLGGCFIVEWVIHRVKKSRLVDGVILAIPDTDPNLILESIGNKLGVDVCRGSEADVLERFQKAITKFEIDNVVRVCADNPFIDANEVDRLIKFYYENDYEYVCNHQNRFGSLYADGFGAEIVSSKILLNFEDKLNPSQREHVTSYIWDNKNDFKIHSLIAPKGLDNPHLRFDLDSPNDLVYLKKLVNLGVSIDSSALEIVRFAKMIE
jgi:spore coat polysaccharide biosynthesis protein SpsF